MIGFVTLPLIVFLLLLLCVSPGPPCNPGASHNLLTNGNLDLLKIIFKNDTNLQLISD